MEAGKRHALLIRAVKTYGQDAQMDMAVEEMAELTKALCKVKRAAPGCETTAAVSNVFEEIADVQIMIDQLRIIFGGSTIDIEDEKLRRLEKRLDSRYMESNLHKWIGENWPGRHIDAGGGGHDQGDV